MAGDNIPSGGATLITKSIADIATDINGFSLAAVPAGMMNGWGAGLNASIFNEVAFTTANKALVFKEVAFTTANKALVFNEAGFSVANINAIIIHNNITDSIVQEILNATTYATRDLTSAASIIYAIHDDWADDKLTSRDNRATTAATLLGANEFAQKFRPEWTVSVFVSVAGGTMIFANAAATKNAEIASTFNVGTWEIDITRSASTNDIVDFYLMYVDGSNHNMIAIDQNSTSMWVRAMLAGGTTTVITTTWSNDASMHTFKTTRDASGNFEIFEDGGSKGTGTNTDITTSAKYKPTTRNATAGSTVTFDNLKVY